MDSDDCLFLLSVLEFRAGFPRHCVRDLVQPAVIRAQNHTMFYRVGARAQCKKNI
jgi:hypothetical protein